MADSFRVVALIAAYNEGDIIGAVLSHLAENGIESYLLDNHSTDDTTAQASRWLGRGLLHIEAFPPAASGDGVESGFDWTSILSRKQELARELSASWFLHHDADEMRESPFPGLTLKEAIQWVDARGYNCIDHTVFDFPPTDDEFEPGTNPRTHFRYYRVAAEYDRTQLKAWKNTGQKVLLTESGGHRVEFPGRRIFPLPFIIRHYPVRSARHGRRKVLQERLPRFPDRERALGWHVQYDALAAAGEFIVPTEELTPFDLEQTRLDALLPERAARELAARLERLDEQLQAVRLERDALHHRLAEYREHTSSLEQERNSLRAHAENLEAELRGTQAHADNLGVELAALRQHNANLATPARTGRDATRDEPRP
jgi:hypothetical protein